MRNTKSINIELDMISQTSLKSDKIGKSELPGVVEKNKLVNLNAMWSNRSKYIYT